MTRTLQIDEMRAISGEGLRLDESGGNATLE
jgi:hypothetical protein